MLEIVETDGMKDGDVCLHSLFEFQEETEGQKGGGSVKGALKKKDGLLHGDKMRAAGIGGW